MYSITIGDGTMLTTMLILVCATNIKLSKENMGSMSEKITAKFDSEMSEAEMRSKLGEDEKYLTAPKPVRYSISLTPDALVPILFDINATDIKFRIEHRGTRSQSTTATFETMTSEAMILRLMGTHHQFLKKVE